MGVVEIYAASDVMDIIDFFQWNLKKRGIYYDLLDT